MKMDSRLKPKSNFLNALTLPKADSQTSASQSASKNSGMKKSESEKKFFGLRNQGQQVKTQMLSNFISTHVAGTPKHGHHARAASFQYLHQAQELPQTKVPEKNRHTKHVSFDSRPAEPLPIPIDDEARIARMSYKKNVDFEVQRMWNEEPKLNPLRSTSHYFKTNRDLETPEELKKALGNHTEIDTSDEIAQTRQDSAISMQRKALKDALPPLDFLAKKSVQTNSEKKLSEQAFKKESAIDRYNRLTDEEQAKELVNPTALSKKRDQELQQLLTKKHDFMIKIKSSQSPKKISQMLKDKSNADIGLKNIDAKQPRESVNYKQDQIFPQSGKKKI